MRGCSLYLDDEPVLVDGDIVVDEMRVSRSATALTRIPMIKEHRR
jgi:hypothetical protein